MSTFEINNLSEKRISINICCLECQKEFSTELDTYYSDQNLPYFNDDTLYCIHCEKPYNYTVKIDLNKLEIAFKQKDIFGKLEYSEEIDEIDFNETTFSSVKRFYFLEIDRLKQLLDLDTENYIVNQSLNRLIFSGVITSLETYLNEIFKLVVFHSNATLEKFIEEYEPYKKEQISLNEIISKYNRLQDRVNEDLDNIIYHNISKLIRIFNIFNFELNRYSSIKSMAKHIQQRHNLVHRSGLDKYNNFQDLSKKEVLTLIEDTNSFVTYIDNKIEEKCYYQDFDFIEF
ncbi:hypothetical protein ABGT15_13825 [Flavobacterium enshiense]|uniref:hypothetical protein n=1 Tax=Flavobacterium enshiense TaxID=1341165 RepID=UPI00345DC0B5